MNKILRGVVRYRQTVRQEPVRNDLAHFEEVQDHPAPTAVMFTCMDSRMLPTRFTQSAVGDMFVVRNAGNIIPESLNYGFGSEVSVTTEPAALELAVKRGGIRHILVCGHSDCKAMNLLYGLHQCPKNFDEHSPMDHWIRKGGFKSMQRLNERLHSGASSLKFTSEIAPSQNFEALVDPLNQLGAEDKLSQVNVLQQLINVASHDFLKDAFESSRLFAHAMWFDVYTGEEYLFSRDKKRFIRIHEETVAGLMKELDRRCGLDGGEKKEKEQKAVEQAAATA